MCSCACEMLGRNRLTFGCPFRAILGWILPRAKALGCFVRPFHGLGSLRCTRLSPLTNHLSLITSHFPRMASAASQFNNDATRMVADLGHRQMVQQSLSGYQKTRSSNANRFQDWESARSRAAATKDEAIRHLDRYLEQFEEKLVARGAKVFWANDATEARTYILDLARAKQARAIVKSKTMVSEEIHLNDALEKAGFQVVESDLGEFIVQLRHEPPYHIVFPAMHLTRGQISDLFQQK